MKKEFTAKAFLRIREIQKNTATLNKLGVDLTGYDDAVNLLEESIVLLFTSNDDDFESALSDIQWWLYDDGDKIITMNKKKIDVTKPKAFVNWLEKEYSA